MNKDVKVIIGHILDDLRVELGDEFNRNFERQAFFSEAWARRRSPTRPGGHILVDSGELRRSIQSRTTENSITFYTTLPYAAIHNDGGEIVVTAKMKRFFWAKYYAATGAFGRKKDGSPQGQTYHPAVIRGGVLESAGTYEGGQDHQDSPPPFFGYVPRGGTGCA